MALSLKHFHLSQSLKTPELHHSMRNIKPSLVLCLGLCALLLSHPLRRADAQDVSGLEQGIKPYGSYDGGNLDSVNLANGSLSLHIPLISYPQRGGKLNVGFSIAYSNPTIGFLNGQRPNCPVPNEPSLCYPSNGTYIFESNTDAYFLGEYGVSVVPNFIPSIMPNLYVPNGGGCQPLGNSGVTGFHFTTTGSIIPILNPSYDGTGDPHGSCGQIAQVADYTVTEADGAAHHLGATGTQTIGGQGSTPPVSAQWFARDTSGYFLDVPSATLTDREGTRYLSSQLSYTSANNPPMCCLSINAMEDINGNRVITNFAGTPSTGQSYASWNDTLGRVIPAPDPSGTTSTDSTGCTGTLATAFAYVWSLPGLNGGTYPVKFCYATPTVTLNPPDCASAATGFCISSTETLGLLQSIVLPNATAWTFNYDSNGCLSKITLPTGGSISYTWTLTVAGTGAKAFAVFETYRWAVSSRTVDDGSGSATAQSTWHYTLSNNTGGYVVVTDPLNNDTVHHFTSQVAYVNGQAYPNYQMYETETDQYAQSSSAGTLLKTTATAYSFAPDPYSKLYAGQVLMNLVPASITTTDVQSGLSSTTTFAYDAGIPMGTHPAGVIPNAIVGNVIQKNEYDFSSSPTVPGTLLRQTNMAYMAASGPNAPSYLASNLLDLPYTTQICDGSQNQYALTQYNYDEVSLQSSGLAGTSTLDANPSSGAFRGNNTSTQEWLSSGTGSCQAGATVGAGAVTSRRVYFDTGTTEFSYDPLGNPTQYSYSAAYQQAFPTTVTNAAGQSTTYQYDLNLGLKTSELDPNHQTTGYTYDVMGRLVNVQFPDNGALSYCYSDLGVQPCQGAQKTPSLLMTRLQSLTATAPQNWPVIQPTDAYEQQVEADVDGLGRKTRVISLTDQTGPDEVDTTYDSVGRVQSVSNPYDSTSEATYGVTSYQYDALGRKLYQCQPDNGASNPNVCLPTNSFLQWSYSGGSNNGLTGLPVDSYDETGRHWRHMSDALGRLTKVLEPDGTTNLSSSPTLETDYVYDPLGNLRTVTQNGLAGEGARGRNFSYDSLSRLTNSSNPETGSIAYTYDLDGNLIQKVVQDPNAVSGNVTLGYCYDNLNRLTSKFYSSPSCSNLASAVSIYQYDTSSISGSLNTLGRITNEESLIGGSIVSQRSPYLYDPMGRLSAEQQCPYAPCPTPYTFQYFYDLAGNVIDSSGGFTGANALYLASGYDGDGRLSATNSSVSGATPALTLFQAIAQSGVNPYSAAGLTNAQLGVNPTVPSVAINLARTYDSRLRLVSEMDQGELQASPATVSSGTITVAGIEQDSPASTSATATLSVTGTEGSHQVCVTTVKSPGFGKPPAPITTCSTVYDTGNLSVVLNNESQYTASAPYGQSTTDATLASSLASALTATGLVIATSSGNTVTMTSSAIGAIGNYPFSITNGADFDGSSTSGMALTGGLTAAFDTGTVTVNVTGLPAMTVNWGSGDSPDSLARRLVSAINGSGALNATTNGNGTVLVNTIPKGFATRWSMLASAVDTATEFSQPSFSVSAVGLSGGADAVLENGAVYSYNLAGNYAANGNLLGYTDSMMGTWGFVYDNLNRLTAGSASSGTFQGDADCFSYDSFGNRLSGTFSANPCPATPLQVPSPVNNRISGLGYSASGNVTGGDGNYYLYDSENRVCAFQGAFGGGLTGYIYDAAGARVAKGTLSGFSCPNGGNFTPTTEFLLGQGGEQVTELTVSGTSINWDHSNAYASGKLLATYDGAGVHFQLSDWLGSKRVQTNVAGIPDETCTSLPFGDNLNCSGTDPSHLHFTGKERDQESGLDYFGARYMSSNMGRFMSPDWSAKQEPVPYSKLDNPQSLNLYSYVLNNPLSNVDPDGHACGGLYMNGDSGFCQRATEYGQIDAKPGVQSQTRFFAAANAVSQALADVATPLSGMFVSGKTANFLEGVGQNLEKLNQTEAAAIQNGSLGGPNLDGQLVHNEQSSVQSQLNSFQQSDSAGYTKAIGEINGSLNGMATQALQQLRGTDRAYAGVLAGVRKDLGRNIDFSKQGDREAIGNALIKHIRQTGGCDVNGKKQGGC